MDLFLGSVEGPVINQWFAPLPVCRQNIQIAHIERGGTTQLVCGILFSWLLIITVVISASLILRIAISTRLLRKLGETVMRKCLTLPM